MIGPKARIEAVRRLLTGRVEMDDTSVGGEHSGGKVERGSEN